MGNDPEEQKTAQTEMANADKESPLLNPDNEHDKHKCDVGASTKAKEDTRCGGAAVGWAANDLPPTVTGEPAPRAQWSSGLFSCLGRTDEFFSSDLEVCMFLEIEFAFEMPSLFCVFVHKVFFFLPGFSCREEVILGP